MLKGVGPLSITQLLPNTSTDGIASMSLTSGTPQQVNIPTGARVAAFAFAVDIWVAFGTTQVAISPSSYSSAGSTQACEFNPTMRYFGGTGNSTAISVYSDASGKGQISFYT